MHSLFCITSQMLPYITICYITPRFFLPLELLRTSLLGCRLAALHLREAACWQSVILWYKRSKPKRENQYCTCNLLVTQRTAVPRQTCIIVHKTKKKIQSMITFIFPNTILLLQGNIKTLTLIIDLSHSLPHWAHPIKQGWRIFNRLLHFSSLALSWYYSSQEYGQLSNTILTAWLYVLRKNITKKIAFPHAINT